uniref:Uncharacterized protein n=1 Tax=Rhizophora mucronata TaxID=61149 RepID=A0A2P2Q7P7_RHIMU
MEVHCISTELVFSRANDQTDGACNMNRKGEEVKESKISRETNRKRKIGF